MAIGTYLGAGGVKDLKECYVGAGGVKTVKEIYVGVGGVPKLVWQNVAPPGEQIFTSSTVWTVPNGVRSVDVFCVGAGGTNSIYDRSASGIQTSNHRESAGAGGGYTATVKGLSVTPGQQISVVVGAPFSGYTDTSTNTMQNIQSGSSSFGNYVEAKGGHSGQSVFVYNGDNWYIGGGSGGSAGGGYLTRSGTKQGVTSYTGWCTLVLSAGMDGTDARAAFQLSSNNQSGYQSNYRSRQYYWPLLENIWDDSSLYIKGTRPDESSVSGYVNLGQGTTTRAFGETDGTLYSTGGDGQIPSSRTFNEWENWESDYADFIEAGGRISIGYDYLNANTGCGASGAETNVGRDTRTGSSGIVIVRWGEQ